MISKKELFEITKEIASSYGYNYFNGNFEVMIFKNEKEQKSLIFDVESAKYYAYSNKHRRMIGIGLNEHYLVDDFLKIIQGDDFFYENKN